MRCGRNEHGSYAAPRICSTLYSFFHENARSFPFENPQKPCRPLRSFCGILQRPLGNCGGEKGKSGGAGLCFAFSAENFGGRAETDKENFRKYGFWGRTHPQNAEENFADNFGLPKKRKSCAKERRICSAYFRNNSQGHWQNRQEKPSEIWVLCTQKR